MKLVYTRWRDVRKLLRSIDEPLGSFTITISPRIVAGRRVYDVEIPQKFIDGSLEARDPEDSEDSRSE